MSRTQTRITARGIALAVLLTLGITYVPDSESTQPAPSLPNCPEPELVPDPITGEPTPLCQLLDAYGVADPAFAHME